MNFFSKLVVIAIIIFAVIYIKDNVMPGENENIFNFGKENADSQPSVSVDTKAIAPMPQKGNQQGVQLVPIYFTDVDNGAIKKITKELPQGQDKLQFAIKELLKGPDFREKSQGYSSEIPKGTRLLSIKDEGSLIIIDVSDEFQYGGGTESQYTRLTQLIKTVVAQKAEKPVYLYINGQKAEAIGGEGIIINQPLGENSLNG